MHELGGGEARASLPALHTTLRPSAVRLIRTQRSPMKRSGYGITACERPTASSEPRPDP